MPSRSEVRARSSVWARCHRATSTRCSGPSVVSTRCSQMMGGRDMTARLLRPLFALPFIVAFASPVHAESCDFYSSVLNGVDNAGFGAQQFSRNEWVVLRTRGIQPAFPPGATANPNEVVITAFVSELFQFDTVDDPIGLPVSGLE